MDSSERFTALAWLCVRVVLAMMLIGAAIALLQTTAPTPKGTTKPWIGSDAPSVVPGVVYAVVLIGAALSIGVGWQLPAGVVVLATLLTVVAVERLIRNPFTNLTADVAMLLALGFALVVAGPERDRWSIDGRRGTAPRGSADRWSWVTLFLRLFVGAIFFTQGFRNLFLGPGPITFAERLYVKPFADTMPEPLLWVMGVSNPFVQVGVGLLLIVGLFTRSAAAVGALFLVSIIFGHLMQGPLTAPGSPMRDFATSNFLVMIAVMIVASFGNRWSVDAWLTQRARK